jgi:hypothetical protein
MLAKVVDGSIELGALGDAAAAEAARSLDIGVIGAAYGRELGEVSRGRVAR